MSGGALEPPAGDPAIAEIADRVIAALRDDLDALTTLAAHPPAQAEQLTVGQVARRLGVARSTVYAHWREWGGYKLGPGAKAPIRFDAGRLPAAGQQPLAAKPEPSNRRPRRPRSRLLRDAPRLELDLREIA